MTGPRPKGDAGRGKHTGRAGWLGGQHRRRGCAGFVVVAGATVIGAAALVLREVMG